MVEIIGGNMETLALITLNWSFRKLGEIMITSLIRYKVADTALTAVLALITLAVADIAD